MDNPGASKGRMGPGQARAMRKELDALRSDTLASLETILTSEQLDEFRRIQAERQEQMRNRVRGRRQ